MYFGSGACLEAGGPTALEAGHTAGAVGHQSRPGSPWPVRRSPAAGHRSYPAAAAAAEGNRAAAALHMAAEDLFWRVHHMHLVSIQHAIWLI